MNNESINNGENPFDGELGETTFCDLVRADLATLEVGDSVPANLHGRSKPRYRSMLTHAASDLLMQVRTKTNSNGVLWIKRVS